MNGFPAHAGMDPRSDARCTRRSRFPRPRGDGPSRRRARPVRTRVSPPTRGWTRRWIGVVVEPNGFPAHAGMDRRLGRLSPRSRRFPRPRGDGPSSRTSPELPSAVSPPTRGWTRHPTSTPPWRRGFPAHAGMDLRCRPGTRAPGGFPRPRGDGPSAVAIVWSSDQVSPPTRDGPGICSAGIWSRWVSPPTRGWTHHLVTMVHHRTGFPAHAGMDRTPGLRRS